MHPSGSKPSSLTVQLKWLFSHRIAALTINLSSHCKRQFNRRSELLTRIRGRRQGTFGAVSFFGGRYVPTEERKVMGFSSPGPEWAKQPWIFSQFVWFYICIPLFIPPFGQICILVVVNAFLIRLKWNSA